MSRGGTRDGAGLRQPFGRGAGHRQDGDGRHLRRRGHRDDKVIEAGAYSGSLAVAVVGTFLPSEALAFSGGATAQLLGDVVQAPAYLALSGGSQMKFGTGKFLMAGRGTAATTIWPRWKPRWTWWNSATAPGATTPTPPRASSPTGRARDPGHQHRAGQRLLPAPVVQRVHAGRVRRRRAGGGRTPPATSSSGATPADGLGVIAGLWTGTTRIRRLSDLIGNKVEVIAGPAGGPDGVHGYLTCTVGPTYSGVLDFRVLLPVQPGRLALIRYAWATDASMAAVPYGPFAGGISVATNAGSSVVRITDPELRHAGRGGAAGGWTATLTGVSGNPGGIPDASLNGTHTIVERLDTNIWSIDTGVAATSSVTGSGRRRHRQQLQRDQLVQSNGISGWRSSATTSGAAADRANGVPGREQLQRPVHGAFGLGDAALQHVVRGAGDPRRSAGPHRQRPRAGLGDATWRCASTIAMPSRCRR